MRHHWKFVFFAAAALGGSRHQPSLPVPIPVVNGTPRELFALRAIDMTEGSGALASPRKCSRRARDA